MWKYNIPEITDLLWYMADVRNFLQESTRGRLILMSALIVDLLRTAV